MERKRICRRGRETHLRVEAVAQPVGFPYNFSLREHLRRSLGAKPAELALRAPWTEDLPGWRAALAERLARLIALPGTLPTPEARLLDQEQGAGYTRARLALAVAPDLAVPAYLLTPDPPPEISPAVLVLAREGAGKAALAGELSPETETALGPTLCRHGLRALIPDLPGCGERAGDEAGLSETLLAQGDSLVAWQAREALALLAYLHTQPETPPGQVGIVGLGGALWPALLAALLAAELKAAVFHGLLESLAAYLIRTNCLQGSSRGDDWLVPGLLPIADLPDLLGAVAPRPLLAAGTQETAGVEPVLSATQKAYELQGCGPRCETHGEVAAEDFPALVAEFMGVWLPARMEM